MQFTNYRHDSLPLEETVRERMAALHVREDDQQAIFAMLAPLGAKREAGNFHRDHSLRVGLLASEIAGALHADERALLFAGLLHDVGKALVPACTLCATERWTEEDRTAMEAHVLDGWRMLRDRFDFTAHVIVWHHAFQSRGYPNQTQLPRPMRVLSEDTLAIAKDYGVLLMLADVFDALHRVNSATGGKALTNEEIKAKMLALKPGGEIVEKMYEKGVFV